MCGIVGIVGTAETRTIGRMLEALSHRGPDGSAVSHHDRIHIGASRLAFLDREGGAQPFISEDGRISIVFNGEIYNHAALRERLRGLGHVFRSYSDTEVLVRLYMEFGEDCVTQLRGMFAFAIVDGNRVFLARDPLGIKPLYYVELLSARTLLFASEIKALLRHPGVTARLDRRTVSDWIGLYQPASVGTFFEGVKLLPPGHGVTITCADGPVMSKPVQYASPTARLTERMILEEAEERLDQALYDSVRNHLYADVDIGVCLSGGLDSTLMALVANEMRPGTLKTFTVGPALPNQTHPDVTSAAYVAQKIRSKHVQVDVSFNDFLDALPYALLATESPCTLSGVPLLLLCRKIGASVKGCLIGEGADELFGGYRDYRDPGYMLDLLKTGRRTLTTAGLPDSETTDALIRSLSAAEQDGPEAYFDEIFRFNMASQLERHHLEPLDKYAMAASVEMRVPFLDKAVLDVVGRLPSMYLWNRELGVQKYLLKRMLIRRFGADYIDIALREKLELPSAGAAFAAPLERLCEELLPEDYMTRHEFGRCFVTKSDLLMFDMFIEIFLNQHGDAGKIGSVKDFMRSRAA